MINLITELQKAFNGDAWHGSNTLAILLNADPTKVFSHFIPNAHSIAEITLHLTSWTEEVADRVSGQPAKEPIKGDWPQPMGQSIAEWDLIVNDFKKANEKLIAALDQINWESIVVDEREPALGSGVNNAELISGLIQHHAYHSGQISLLSKF